MAVAHGQRREREPRTLSSVQDLSLSTLSSEKQTLLVGLNLLPSSAPAPAVIRGIINLAQASACATDKWGGPMLDACTGSTGCAGPAST